MAEHVGKGYGGMMDPERYYMAPDGSQTTIPPALLHREDTAPPVSVIVPCYNYGRYLPEAIASIQAQTFRGFEIVIVDDGSPDVATRDIVRSFVGHPAINVLFQNNTGLPGARNAGIGAARGRYICCLDADDTFAPTYLERCIALLESRANVGFAYSWVKLFGDESSLWETRDYDIDVALQENWTPVCAMFRKTDWILIGGYDPRMRGGYEDWEFWMRLAQIGRTGHVIQEPLMFHRRHGHTMTFEAKDRHEELVARIRRLNHRLYEDRAWLDRVRQVISAQSADTRQPATASGGAT